MSVSVLLAVDDRPDNLFVLEQVVGEYLPEIKMITAESAEAGLALVATEAIDGALIDVQMPGLNGIEMCRRLKSDPRTAPIHVILVTAHGATSALKAQGLEAGADDFITKPIDNVELAAKLRVMLRLRAAEQALRRERDHLDEAVQERTQELRGAEYRYRTLFNAAADAIFINDLEERVLEVNEEACRLLGYTRDELLHLTVSDMTTPESAARRPDLLEQLQTTGHLVFENELVTQDGRIIPTECSSRLMDLQGKPAVLSISRDITKRKQAEEALRESEQRFRHISSTIADICYSCTTAAAGRFFIDWIVGAAERITGYSIEEIKAQRCWGFLVVEEDLPLFEKHVTGLVAGSSGACELRLRHKNGGIVWAASCAECVKEPGPSENLYLYGGLVDITGRKRAEESLAKNYQELQETAQHLEQSRNMLQLIIESVPVRVFWKDRNLRFMGCNTLFARDAGLNHPQQLLGKDDFAMGWREQADLYRTDDRQVMESRCPKINIVELQTTPTGAKIWLNTSKVPLQMPNGEVFGILGVYEDVTDRKLAADALRESEKLFRSLFENMLNGFAYHKMLFQQNRPQDFIFLNVNSSFETLTGLKNVVEKKISEVIPGIRESDPGLFEIYGRVALTGKPERFETYVEAMKMWFSISVYSPEKEYFVTVFDDITGRKLAEEALKESLARTTEVQYGTIQALATVTETRDPYTSGHQRRVTQLACAIAQELGLPADRVAGLRVMGLLHDIGKISIPAEILSKPGKLNDIEFAIIKSHAQTGYEIVKEIRFPWPVAEVILQHHERLDGSGYPQGLQGDEIVLEAKILAVADVVEAMSSHRPYRPGLEIDQALEEITKNMGTLYDPEVVEACVNLFTKKEFRFQT